MGTHSGKMKKLIPTFLVALILGCATPHGGLSPAARFDPASADPPQLDAEFPPSLAEIEFVVDAARLNGIVYEAQGAGPHPTVVLLHGFPGNEQNLDLAQAIRRASWNVVFFHYRGAWSSGGLFSFEGVLADVAGCESRRRLSISSDVLMDDRASLLRPAALCRLAAFM